MLTGTPPQCLRNCTSVSNWHCDCMFACLVCKHVIKFYKIETRLFGAIKADVCLYAETSECYDSVLSDLGGVQSQ